MNIYIYIYIWRYDLIWSLKSYLEPPKIPPNFACEFMNPLRNGYPLLNNGLVQGIWAPRQIKQNFWSSSSKCKTSLFYTITIVINGRCSISFYYDAHHIYSYNVIWLKTNICDLHFFNTQMTWQNEGCSISTDNGLAPNRRLVIIWTNDAQFIDTRAPFY